MLVTEFKSIKIIIHKHYCSHYLIRYSVQSICNPHKVSNNSGKGHETCSQNVRDNKV